MWRLVLSAIVLSSAPVIAQKPEEPIKTTICEIKASPSAFNKKLVEVSGYASHGFEDSMFEDPTCFESKSNPGIWMEYGGTASTDTMYCCGGTPSKQQNQLEVQGITIALVRDNLFDQMDKLLHASTKDATVKAKVRARFFISPEWQKDKPHILSGYGHMGCCALLAIEQVISVDSKKPGPSIFDLAKKYEKQKP